MKPSEAAIEAATARLGIWVGSVERVLQDAYDAQFEDWFIEREDGQKVAGPFETKADAHMARVWVEIAKNPETFWIRKDGER